MHCSRKGHEFRALGTDRIFCARCGEFRTAPSGYALVYPYTYPTIWPTYNPTWSNGAKTLGTINVGSTVTYDDGTAVTYTND